MDNDSGAPYAIWFLRLTLAIALLAHVSFNSGSLAAAAAIRWLGLPADGSNFGISLEVLIALALVFGIWPRAAALAGAGVLVGAIVIARGPAILTGAHLNWTASATWIGAHLLLSLAGDGAFTLVPTATHPHREKRQ
jgi:uncharacterized membrane protein YphA (DoxX/SURF4 family)